MRLRNAGTLVLAALAVACLAPPARAQLTENLGGLTSTNAEGYMSPLPTLLSGTLNSSIFQSGYVPKSGFTMNVGFRIMGVNTNDDDRTYMPTDPPGFTTDPAVGIVPVPTVIGNTLAVAQTGVSNTVLYYPSGFDVDEFATGTVQVNIGSVYGTRAAIRWLSVDVTDNDFGKLSLFGGGLQHSISQYFQNWPVDAALGIFYQTFEVGSDLVKSNAFHFDVTGSKRYNWFQPYLGVGYDMLDMDVHYASTTGGGNIDVNFPSENSMHFTIGAQAILAVVHLYAEANLAATNGYAVGLSFGNGY